MAERLADKVAVIFGAGQVDCDFELWGNGRATAVAFAREGARVVFTNGEGEIAPGITVHRVGGHTHGMQIVRVWTRDGWLVLASDAVHMYANLEKQNPYPAAYNVFDMLEGAKTAVKLANGNAAKVIPGHDPMKRERFSAPTSKLDGIVLRLD